MALHRLSETTLVSDRVYEALRGAIMEGDLASGTRLRVDRLAEQLGTSTMPVREALTRLEHSGLAQRTPRRGAVVTKLTPAELTQVYEARLLLEPEAAQAGSHRVNAQDVDRMWAEHRATLAAAGSAQHANALDHDEALLAILYSACGNPVVVELIRSLWRRCRPYKLLGVGTAQTRTDPNLWSHQLPLIEAASAHDSRRAGNVTETALRRAIDRIWDALD